MAAFDFPRWVIPGAQVTLFSTSNHQADRCMEKQIDAVLARVVKFTDGTSYRPKDHGMLMVKGDICGYLTRVDSSHPKSPWTERTSLTPANTALAKRARLRAYVNLVGRKLATLEVPQIDERYDAAARDGVVTFVDSLDSLLADYRAGIAEFHRYAGDGDVVL